MLEIKFWLMELLLEERAVYVRLHEPVESGARLFVTSEQGSVEVEACAASQGCDLEGRRPTLVRVVGGVE